MFRYYVLFSETRCFFAIYLLFHKARITSSILKGQRYSGFPNQKPRKIIFLNKSNSPGDENRRSNYSTDAIFFWHLALCVRRGSCIRLCLSIPIDRINFVGVRHPMMHESMPWAWRLDSRARANLMRAWSRVSFQLSRSGEYARPLVYGCISAQGRAWCKLREIVGDIYTFCPIRFSIKYQKSW